MTMSTLILLLLGVYAVVVFAGLTVAAAVALFDRGTDADRPELDDETRDILNDWTDE